MTKPKLFTALLLVLFAAGGLFAERDSLCMRIVDEWDAPDSLEFWPCAMEVVGDYIYMPSWERLWVFSISDSGIISIDTTLIDRDFGLVYDMAIADTFAFVLSNPDIVVLNVANPAHPESVTTLTGLFSSSTSAKEIFAYDTVLYLTESPSAGDWDGPLKRINVRDPYDIYEIPTSSSEVPHNFQFPYLYGIDAPPSGTQLLVADLRQADSVAMKLTTGISGLSWVERHAKGLAVRDSFVFVPCMLSYVRSFMTDSEFDTLVYLDEYREPWYEGDDGGFLLSDTLLFAGWDLLLRVFNTSDPTNILKIGEYQDTIPYRRYMNFAYIDSYLVATFSGGGWGVIVFKFPCTGCEGNCELDLVPEQLDFDVSPNPFNDRCNIRFSHDESKSSELAIFDIRGRKVEEKTLSFNTSNYVWDASDEASGVYLVVLSSGERKISRRLILMK